MLKISLCFCYIALCNCTMCIAIYNFRRSSEKYICNWREDDTIVHIRCPPLFSVQSVIATHETLWRLCGYGVSPVERYLDDLVNIILVYIYYIKNEKHLKLNKK